MERVTGANGRVVIIKHNPSVGRACSIDGVWLHSGDDTSSAAWNNFLTQLIPHGRQTPAIDELGPIACLQHCMCWGGTCWCSLGQPLDERRVESKKKSLGPQDLGLFLGLFARNLTPGSWSQRSGSVLCGHSMLPEAGRYRSDWIADRLQTEEEGKMDR